MGRLGTTVVRLMFTIPGHEGPGATEKSVVSSSNDGVEVTRDEITGQIADGTHGRFHPPTQRGSAIDQRQTVADVIYKSLKADKNWKWNIVHNWLHTWEPVSFTQIAAQRMTQIVLGTNIAEQGNDALQSAVDHRSMSGDHVTARTSIFDFFPFATVESHVHVGQVHRVHGLLQLLPGGRMSSGHVSSRRVEIQSSDGGARRHRQTGDEVAQTLDGRLSDGRQTDADGHDRTGNKVDEFQRGFVQLFGIVVHSVDHFRFGHRQVLADFAVVFIAAVDSRRVRLLVRRRRKPGPAHSANYNLC